MPRGRGQDGKFVHVDDDVGGEGGIKYSSLWFLVGFCILVVIPWVYFLINIWNNSCVGKFFNVAIDALILYIEKHKEKKPITPL